MILTFFLFLLPSSFSLSFSLSPSLSLNFSLFFLYPLYFRTRGGCMGMKSKKHFDGGKNRERKTRTDTGRIFVNFPVESKFLSSCLFTFVFDTFLFLLSPSLFISLFLFLPASHFPPPCHWPSSFEIQQIQGIHCLHRPGFFLTNKEKKVEIDREKNVSGEREEEEKRTYLMNKDIGSTIEGRNESPSFGYIEPFAFSSPFSGLSNSRTSIRSVGGCSCWIVVVSCYCFSCKE